MPEDFHVLIDKHLNNDMLPKKGSIIETDVIQINTDYVVVNVGTKQEGFISRKEFNVLPSVGETIKVYVEAASSFQIKLSFLKASKFDNINILKENMENRTPTEGTITKLTPNGYLVQIMGWEAFLPFSQVLESATTSEEEKKKLVNKKDFFTILKVEPRGDQQSIIVSKKKLLSSNKQEDTKKYMETNKIGDIVTGKVVKINDKSVLIELTSNVIGLIPIGNISWDHIAHPSEKLTLQEDVSLKITDYNLERNSIILSMKDVNNNIWESFFESHSTGDIVKGKIVSIKDHFMILWIQEGVKGILHRSNMSWGNFRDPLTKIYKLDQIIDCQIIDIDKEKLRISLGLKQLTENPWSKFNNEYSIGSQIDGTIIKKTDFALFIDIGDGIQAMLHKNDLSWNIKEQNLDNYREGDNINCTISKIDLENNKISCTLKSDDNNVWKSFARKYGFNSIVTGEVAAENQDGFVLILDGLLEAFLPFSHVPKELGLTVGSKTDVLVTHFVPQRNMIKISVKALKSKENETIVNNYNQTSETVKAPTLGDIFNFPKNDR